MDNESKVAVCSRSFSKNIRLRNELLAEYKNVLFNDDGAQLSGDKLIEFLKDHDKAITALETIDDYVLANLPNLKVIGKYGVGLDMIDLSSMRHHGVKLGWTGGVNKRSVTELVLSLAINLLRNIRTANDEILGGTWRQLSGGQLSGRTVGIIGCGNVGKDLVEILRPFGCKILVNDIRQYPDFYTTNCISAVSLSDLMKNSDVVSIHVPLNETTVGFIDKRMLLTMKPTAILINTARGGIVDESALKGMLKDELLAGAAFDVFESEPPLDRELLELSNFIATPHIGGSSEEAVLAMGRAATKGLRSNSLP